METLPEVKKALFTSPGVDINEKLDNSSQSLNSHLQIEYETDIILKNSQKDRHEQRLKKFRKIAKRIPEDEWFYPPIEKLIGLK